MKRVYQTRFGGESAPPEHQGNCAQACIASILELDLDDVIDITKYDDDIFFDKLREWLMDRGYFLMCISSHDWDGKPMRLPGYYIVGGPQVSSGVKHVEVAYNGEIIHDPISPNFISRIDPKEIWLIYPLNPVKIGDKCQGAANG